MDSRQTTPEPSGSTRKRKASELGREHGPTREEKGKWKETKIEEIYHPSKRRKVERGPDHMDRELNYRCQEMDPEDFDKVLSKACDTLTTSRNQATKVFDSQILNKQSKSDNREISAYNNALSLLANIGIPKGEYDNMREEMLEIIQELREKGRDLKNEQARGQQLNVGDHGTVKAAKALEDAILDLPNLYRHEKERLEVKANKLKSDYMTLEIANDNLAQNFVIKDMNGFITHLRQCGQRFYNISIAVINRNRYVQKVLRTYKQRVENKENQVVEYLGRLRLENGTPQRTSENFEVDTDSWSHLAQDMRLLAGIHAEGKVDGVDDGGEARKKTTVRTEFHFVLPFRKEHLWDERDNKMTLMAREAMQLMVSGYVITNRNPEVNEGNAGVESLESYAYKTYPYATCIDVVKAQMASLSNFRKIVEMYEVKQYENEADEDFKRRIKETKEDLWKLFSLVLEPDEDKGVVAEASASQAMARQPEIPEPGDKPTRKRKAPHLTELGEESSQLDRPTGEDKGKGKQIGREDTNPSKRRKVETRDPDHAYQELKYRCDEMDFEDLGNVISNARNALRTSQDQVMKGVYPDSTQQNYEFSIYSNALVEWWKGGEVEASIPSLIKRGKDLKNTQAQGKQLNVRENGIVKAAEAFEDAIWGLAKHYQHENEQIKATIERLKAQNKDLEAKNEKLAQKHIIRTKEKFVQSAQECGEKFYNGPIKPNDPATRRAYWMYRKAERGPMNGMVILGRVKEEDTQPAPSNESEPYMDAAANASFLLTDDDMSKPTGSIMGLKKDVFTVFSNDGWVYGAVKAKNVDPGQREKWVRPYDRATNRTEFHFASPFTKKNLWDEEEGRITLMAREAIQLLASGYSIRNRDPKLSNEGNAGVKSLEHYTYKTYPYAICVDGMKADMVTLLKFKEAVEPYYKVERKKGETQEEYKRRMETDENLKTTKKIKEDLWELFSSVLEPEKDKGVETEAPQAMGSSSSTSGVK